MALIGTIRKQSGLLVIIVGVALAAFVLGDFLKPRRGMRQTINIAEVQGEEIPYSQFDNRLEKNIEIQKTNQKKDNLTQDELFRLKQQTYDQIVDQIILEKQYDKIGLHVTADELFDQIQGEHPHPYILQYFKDPQTGQYDPEIVRNYIKQLGDMDQASRTKWDDFVNAIEEDRYKTKYKKLLTAAYIMPDTFLSKDYIEKKTNADIRLVGVKFSTIPDSAVEVSDQDMQNYYDKYKQNYKQEESRDIEYVIFDVKPSASDRKKIRDDVQAIFEDFKKAENIPLFVNSESDNRYDSTFHKKGELPLGIDSVVFDAKVGTFVEPYIQNKTWHMAKLMDIQYRPDSMKASHVLVTYKGARMAGEDITRTKEQAKKIADSLLNVIKKSPGRIEQIASEVSDDPSAEKNSGDLGWFADGAMVYPFNHAVLTHDIGDVVLVESQFGFHIIKVTGKKEPEKKVRVAVIDIAITPSQDTYQEEYTRASAFQGKANSIESFDTLSTSEGLSKRSATYLQPMADRIAGIDYPRTIVQWAYTEGIEVGTVSPVFTLNDKYVIAILTAIHEAGIPDLDEIRDRMEPLVLKDLKGDVVMEKLKEAKNENPTLAYIAGKLNTKVDTVTNINFHTRNVAGFGNETNLVAEIFNTDQGVLSEPVKGNNAGFVFIVDEVHKPQNGEDRKMYEQQLLMNFKAKVNNNSYIQTIEDESDIVDNRVRFY